MSEPKHSFLQSLFPKHAREVTDSMSERWPMEQDIAGIVQDSSLCISLQSPDPETIHNSSTLLFDTISNRVLNRQCHRKTQELYADDIETAANEVKCETLHHDLLGPQSSPLPVADLNRIFMNTSSQLYRFLKGRVQCPETAADLTQEVYLRLPQIQTSVVSEVGVRAWLFRVASNLSIDHLRSQRRHAELLNRFYTNETDIDKAPGPFRAAMDRDRLQQVQNALQELPDQCAEVLYLSRIEGYSHAAIARQLGISKSLVEKQISRALNHCRQVVDEEDE